MSRSTDHRPVRVLVVDDNRAIHDDFRKILAPTDGAAELDEMAAKLFGKECPKYARKAYRVESAYQGEQAADMVTQAAQEGDPYLLAFVDMRMPPGWDGVTTIEHLWRTDPTLQVVICTAYSDYTWSDVIDRLGTTDRLLILKKPFDNIEVSQMAAGVAAEMLIAEGHYETIENGVVLGAIMHTLGRIVLGTLYPNEYSAMVEICKKDGVPLAGQEIRVFSATHASIMARVLAAWNIPSEIYLPLSHVLDSYQEIEDLRLPLKTQVQLVKLSILIGRIAVGRWEPWDLVEIPPPAILEDLRIGNLADIVERTKVDLQDILAFRVQKRSSGGPERHGNAASAEAPIATYCDLSGGPHDLLPLILQGIGLKTIRNRAIDDCGEAERLIVDCRGSAPEKHAALDELRNRGRLMILCDPADIRGYKRIGRAVPVPRSFVTLAATCKEMFLAEDGNVPI